MNKNTYLRHISYIAKHGKCSDAIDLPCHECPLDKKCMSQIYFPDITLKEAANMILAELTIDKILRNKGLI
jgi:hypothetical protein